MNPKIFLATVFSFSLITSMAFAGAMPNLVGDWKSSGKGGVSWGKLGHTEAAATPQFGASPEFTLRITKQDGHRFHGERFSAKMKETVLGVIDDDGKSIYMVDDDGVFICNYNKAKDSIKIRYMEPGNDAKVVGIAVYTRVKK